MSAFHWCMALALSGCAAVADPVGVQRQPQAIVTVTELNARPEAFVGRRVSVRGRLAVDERLSANAGPCNRATGAGCNPVVEPRLVLRDEATDSPRLDPARSLELYRTTRVGTDAPFTCAIIGAGAYDCSPYKPGTEIVLQGIFKRATEPVQQVIDPNGTTRVLRTRDIFFLVVS